MTPENVAGVNVAPADVSRWLPFLVPLEAGPDGSGRPPRDRRSARGARPAVARRGAPCPPDDPATAAPGQRAA